MGVGLIGDLGKYLGVPIIHKRASYMTFAPLIENTKKRLSGWKRGYLNLVGRTILIKTVLSVLPTYYMQTIFLPKRIVKELEQSSRGFLWGDTEN
ncbi:hypothetical protein K1719_009606 [Acacia pycnantha]|nr:hypothetical protein K1719_009606 [Acacia pycnantha]